MRKLEGNKMVSRSCVAALLLVIFLCGCGREQTVSPVPVVVSTSAREWRHGCSGRTSN